MASPFQIHYRSAISKRTKRDSLLQEGIRRLRNLGPTADQLEVKTILSIFMNSLMISGYDHKFRYHLMRGIFNHHEQFEREISLNNRVRYRSREEILAAKAKKIGKHPATWFLKGNVQNTMKVQGAPESGLLNTMREVFGGKICAEGGATKFIELGGKLLTAGLSGSEKFTANSGCVFGPSCYIDPEFDCRTTRSVYEVECNTCVEDPGIQQRSLYIGTSGRMLHAHQKEHMGDIRLGRRTNALYKQSVNVHPNVVPNFCSRPIIGSIRYNLDRFITEGHLINKSSLDRNIEVLNSRAEWGHYRLPRLQVNQD